MQTKNGNIEGGEMQIDRFTHHDSLMRLCSPLLELLQLLKLFPEPRRLEGAAFVGVNASSCTWQLLYFGEQEVITGGSRELPIGFNKPRAVLAEARPDDEALSPRTPPRLELRCQPRSLR